VVAISVVLLATLCGAEAPAQSSPAAAPSRVRTVFRIFDRAREVTSETRLRVRRAGTSDPGIVLQGPRLEVELEPGIYDAQAIRELEGRVAAVRWAERLVIMAYPDEGSQHLETVNMAEGYGALQLRLPDGAVTKDRDIVRLASPPAADRAEAVGVFAGPDYLLMIGPTGTYDLRVTLDGARAVDVTGIEVPADRTRLRVLSAAP
jgi:hypothetical protein